MHAHTLLYCGRQHTEISKLFNPSTPRCHRMASRVFGVCVFLFLCFHIQLCPLCFGDLVLHSVSVMSNDNCVDHWSGGVFSRYGLVPCYFSFTPQTHIAWFSRSSRKRLFISHYLHQCTFLNSKWQKGLDTKKTGVGLVSQNLYRRYLWAICNIPINP